MTHDNMKLLKILVTVMLLLLCLTACKTTISVGVSKNVVNDEEKKSFEGNGFEEKIESICNQLKKSKDIKDITELEEQLNIYWETNNNDLANIYFASESGELILVPTPKVEFPEDFDARTRIWYTEAKEKGEYISEIMVYLSNNKKFISLSKYLALSEELFGVLGIDFMIEESK